LVVTIDGGEMIVRPIGENGSALKLKDRANGDKDWVGPIKVKA
jgi:hypothetical protein